MTTTFLVIGGFGVLLIGLSLVSGAHLHIGHVHLHLPVRFRSHHGGDGTDAFSLPGIAGFIGAFGFAGAITAQLTHERSGLLASLVGLVAAVPTAWFGTRMMRAAMEMRTDATPGQDDVVGAIGVVIRAIPLDGYGDVRVSFAGQYMKFHARAATALPAGTPILVIGAPSTTSVVVESTTSLLG